MRGRYVLFILIWVFAALTFSNTKAQGSFKGLKDTTPEERAQFQTNLMRDKLKLDAGQVNKVQVINLKYARKFEPVIKSDDSMSSKIQKAKALQVQKDKELQQVFNKEQFNRYQAFEAALRKKLKEAAKS